MKLLTPVVFLVLIGCGEKKKNRAALFSDITAASGISFQNDLSITDQFNPYTYRNFYNGAGVAIGDINNDGLQDIYFVGNQVDNKLYLNLGGLEFKDITDTAGVACSGVWSTGVTFADVNGDGLLDLYVCKSGNPDVPGRHNELFINNGDLTFTERAKEYGLDVVGLSVQAVFFDFDKDSDLDCYLLTNSFKSIGSFDLIVDQRKIPDPLGGGNKFFLNDNGKFRDYTREAGVYSSSIGFGLGITLGDFNGDDWTDIFISNDFFERDYLYINDQKGAFKESLTDYFESISMGSMGADYADLDNDGIRELLVTEMLPDSLHRKKTKTIYESWDKYQMNVKSGYHHQVSRNVLQKKIGEQKYAELGRFAGIAASEWSWGALIFDMDNDGRKDVFVANGIYKDLLDRDHLTYTGADDNIRKMIREDENAIVKLIDLMPSSKFPNYAFRNEGNLRFKNASLKWGLGDAMFSSGSAYGDLDNDGDLDLVVNNINGPSVLYRNNTDSSEYKSITIALSSGGKNTFAVGSEITAYCGENIFFADNFVTRAFQSAVHPVVTIGLGRGVEMIDSVLIKWTDGGYSVLYNIPVNQRVHIAKEKTHVYDSRSLSTRPARSTLLSEHSSALFRHQSNGLNDFNRDRLLPMMYSNETPSVLQGDINGDGVEEVYVGGGKGQPGSFIQFSSEKPKFFLPESIGRYHLAEETKGAFVDLDRDGDLDLYMASGGRLYPKTSSVLVDKLFLNDGQGQFHESPHPLPFTSFISTSVVKSIDFDNDGDADLLVGERFDPFAYGTGGRGYLLENDGEGRFQDVTQRHVPGLLDIGMITDIEVRDFDGDGWEDILIAGDWMPIVMLRNNIGNFVNVSEELGLSGTEGWWHDIDSGDFNKDGKADFVLGNHGLNTFFRPGDRIYINDFDRNGSVEQIFCTEIDGKYYPIVDKDELISQLPFLKKDLLYYKDYGKKSIEEIFPESVLATSKVLQVNLMSSMMLLSDGNGYRQVKLPLEIQYSPVYAILVSDFDNDGIEDIIVGGNQYQVKPQFGRYDASSGWFCKGTIQGDDFSFKPGVDLNVKGQIRDIILIEAKGSKYILFAKHDDDLEMYTLSD